MQSRRSLRLVAGALVLAAPVLSSCGFQKATDKVYIPAAQTNDRSSADIDVLAGSVVAAQPNSGTVIATFVSKTLEDLSLESVAGAGASSDLVIGPVESPIDIPPRGHVNLADDAPGITVQGDFGAGDFLDLAFTFSNGETITFGVPVLFGCQEWEGLDTSVEEEEDSASASPSATPGATPSSSPSASASSDGPEPGEPYNCDSVLEETGDASATPSDAPTLTGEEAE
ncbi:hypothetical protein [Nocardioides flavescens]|uniref:Copper(I)-binding protein n=1 Tax=Nocardioides flavescens TaxID=2691959 RepID=A0A6L7F2S8_9ACTN|nr:hypothetical protein [Nocardioides flavescens]MXG90004.1 hypothetical protein [Nocardioides flavescens]